MKSIRWALGTVSRRFIEHDEGMTLIEIMVASAILMFAMTAVFSLIIASTGMSISAKQQNLAINVANSYMEQVRAMPYESVGVPGQSVVGSLTADATSTVEGFAVSIQTTVAWVDDPNILGPNDYKHVVVLASVTAPNGGKTISRTFSTYVRKNTDLQAPPDWRPPTITFNVGSSPADGAVVYDSVVHVQVTATSMMTNGTIQDVSIRCDTGLLAGTGTDGVVAAHWGGLATQTGTFDFYWDTTHVFDGGVTLRDGPHWLVADVVDSIGQTREVRIGIVIDNAAPTALSAAPAAVPKSDVLSTLTWGKAWDPEGPTDVGADCWGYALNLRRQPTSSAATYSAWSQVATPTVVAQVTYPAVTAAFSRYWCSVTPVSPRGLTGPSQEVVWVSPPKAAGTYSTSGNGSNKIITTVITLSAPTFENSSRSYTLYRSTAPAGPWTTELDTTSSLTATQAYTYTDTQPKGAKNLYYYRVKAVITPAGLGDLAPLTLWSNAIGPNGTDGPGTLPSLGW